MAWTWLLLFAPACFALNAAPGPNNVLAFATSAQAGARVAILGGAGRLVAFAGMIGLTAAGLGLVLAASETAFLVVKVLGAFYLVHVGVMLWRAPVAAPISAVPRRVVLRAQLRREFLVAAGNPKAIAIFTAFFPQFLDRAAPVAPQVIEMGLVFLVLEALALTLYAVAGRLARGLLGTPGRMRLLNRGTGGFLVFSGITLALSTRS